MQLIFSPQESARFGRKVFRAFASQIDPTAMYTELRAKQADLLILRVPASKLAQVQLLADIGLRPIVADTLVYYQSVPTAQHFDWAPEVRLLRLTSPQDHAAELESVVRGSFKGYTNHYSANPTIDPEHALAGFVEWVQSCCTNDLQRFCWLIQYQGKPAGFSSVTIDSQGAEGVLAGILPEFQGLGLYRGIVADMLAFTARNCPGKPLIISTQVQHYAVQQVLNSLGMRIFKAVNTVHINLDTKLGKTKQA